MLKFAGLAILISFAFCAHANTVFQTDWSSGPGEEGPVPQWLNSFYIGSGVDISQPGFMKLGTGVVSYEENIVSPDFGAYGIVSPGDFDGDGDIDIICDDMDQWKFNLFENLDGAGTQWQEHYLFDMPWIPNKGTEVVDLDSDGDLDLLTATGGYFTFWENSDGTGLNWIQNNLRSEELGDAAEILSLDIDKDGDLDVIGSDNSRFHFYLAWENIDGNGHQWEEHIIDQSDDSWPMYIETADIDSDDDVDLFFINRNCSPSYTGWYEYLGSWTWEKHVVTTAPMAQSLSTADYDNDGDMDYAVAIGSSCRIWENLDGTGGDWEFHNCPGIAGFRILHLHSLDIDYDGDIDIITSGRQNNTDDLLIIFENLDGRGIRWGRYDLKTEHAIVFFRGIADINKDGYIDIIGSVISSISSGVVWCDVMGPAHTGWIESAILDVTEYPLWENISWISDEPTGTDVSFLLRTSNDPEDMGAWCDTISNPGDLTGYIDSTHRYIQYIACLTTDSDEYAPVLDEVNLVWSSSGIEAEGEYQNLAISVSPNPSCNEVFITVPAWGNDVAEVSIYDISGKLVRVITDRVNEVFHWNFRSPSGQIVPVGTYIVRCVSGDMSSTARLVRL